MDRFTVARTIAADPASTALLLAGPGALDLCPAPLTLRATLPVRTATAYETRFECPAGHGRILVRSAYPGATRATLEMSYDPSLGSPLEAAEAFLANLAHAAEQRSTAA